MPGGSKCFAVHLLKGDGIGGGGILNLYSLHLIRKGLSETVELEDRPEGREAASQVAV